MQTCVADYTSVSVCVGRSTLQKRVMALLRRIEHPTAGNIEVKSSFVLVSKESLLAVLFSNFYVYQPQAWEDTHAKWEQATKQILNHPKNKVEDGQASDAIIPLFSPNNPFV